jgi:hypothetical protein
VVRIAALGTTLLIWAPFVHDASLGSRMVSLLGLPYVGHYLLTLWRLRAQTPKRGLALAVGTGSVVFVIAICLLVFVGPSQDWGWKPISYLGSLALVQALLVASAIRTYYSMPREAGDRKILWVGFKYGAAYLLIFLVGFAIWAPNSLRNPVAANQASAVGSLRTIDTAALTYLSKYANGFPPDLRTLGPPSSGSPPSCNTADLIDSVLASGQRSGYKLDYKPGPRVEKPPAGCPPGVTSYSVSARPVAYGKTGEHSFFTDESGVIRWTEENRPATAQDPPLGQ